MFDRAFPAHRLLRSLLGTEPFTAYCGQHCIPFDPTHFDLSPSDAAQRWAAALAQLPPERHALIELELGRVQELADEEGTRHLLEAAHGKEIPHDDVPGHAPLALWFLLHHPAIFHEVFLQHEIQEVQSWRTAHAVPGLSAADLATRSPLLADRLKAFFQAREGTGRFCVVDAQHLTESACFVAHVADRLQFVESFTESGETALQKLRPSVPLLFVYYPRDGSLLLKSPLRSRERILELLQCFGDTVLGVTLDEDCLAPAFALDRLKLPFHPLPDAVDMELVRVKALHLCYPARLGRRQVKLDTLVTDTPTAIEELLQAHLGGPQHLVQLSVIHAQLQVKLRIEGRSKSYLIRLWPNRCNLTQTPVGERLRSCLRRWGLTHVR